MLNKLPLDQCNLKNVQPIRERALPKACPMLDYRYDWSGLIVISGSCVQWERFQITSHRSPSEWVWLARLAELTQIREWYFLHTLLPSLLLFYVQDHFLPIIFFVVPSLFS